MAMDDLFSPRSADSPGRIRALDLARGLAVIGMLGTHATNVFLADGWKHDQGWYLLDTIFGFVAPAFTFLSGVAIFHALRRRIESGGVHRYRKTLRSLLRLLLLGYWLQIPILSIRQLIWCQRPEELAKMFDANILQTIAVAGLLVVGLHRISGSIDRGRRLALVLGVAIMIATPFIWNSGISQRLPILFSSYLAPQPPAAFPLFPYAAYLLLGFFSAPLLTSGFRSIQGGMNTFLAGSLFLALGLLLDPLLHPHPPFDDFWRSSPQHTLFRIGGIIVLAGIATLISCSTRPKRIEPLLYIGRKSLPFYLLHLILVYRSPVAIGVRSLLPDTLAGTLSPATTLGITIILLLFCYAAIRGWEWLRERSPSTTRWVKIAWWGVFWGIFLLKP